MKMKLNRPEYKKVPKEEMIGEVGLPNCGYISFQTLVDDIQSTQGKIYRAIELIETEKPEKIETAKRELRQAYMTLAEVERDLTEDF